MAKSSYVQQKKREQAFALINSGNVTDAGKILKKICQKDRQDIESWMSMGMLLAQTNDFNNAIPYFKHITNIRTNIVDAYLNLSSCYGSIKDTSSAIATCNNGLQYFPDNIDLIFNKACLLLENKNLQDAEPLFSHCIQLAPQQLDSYLNLAYIHNENLAFDSAREIYLKALTISPDNNHISAEIANTYIKQGDHKEAYGILKPLIENKKYNTKAAFVFAKIALKLDLLESAVNYIQACIQHAQKDDENLVRAYLSLGQLYDKTKDHEHAFQSFTTGNLLKTANYMASDHSAYIESLITLFDDNFISQNKNISEHELTPIFIVGMPRSGTTLIEQIICSHPSVYGAGELKAMSDTISDISTAFMKGKLLAEEELTTLANNYFKQVQPKLATEKIFTDKMPSNALRLGFIQMLFPNAKIIHCLRNPLDTCLSCYSLDFKGAHDYAYKLKDLGHYYNEYRRLMKHWKKSLQIPVFDIQYEELVSAQEEKSRQLLDFCDIEWDPACLNFHENKRVAVTASNQQVRHPIYKGSIQRWRNYEEQLKPLIDALEPEYRREAGVEDWDY